MLFTSPLFLFGFFPLFFALYFASPARRLTLLAGSLLFYFWGEPEFLGVVLAAAALDWQVGRLIAGAPDRKAAFRWLTLGVSVNLGVLFYAKYCGFLAENLNVLWLWLGAPAASVPEIPLPLGVSFFIFEEITYLVDVYRGVAAPARSRVDYLNYLLLFPKMLAGPIVKYHDISEQLRRPSPGWLDFRDGLLRFIRGLARKVVIADSLAPFVDEVFALQPSMLHAGAAWLGLLGFTVQIYFDFAGYSDMAIGMARMLGFRLAENFRDPYLSTSITEFWRRWHISLSSWIREYLYIPLGGNRVGAWRGYLNLTLCFALSGLWHGASWNFLIWGCLHGFGLILDRLFWLRASARWPRLLRGLFTASWVMFAWVFFRCPTLSHAGGFLRALGGAFPGENDIFWRSDVVVVLGLAGLLILKGSEPRGEGAPRRPFALLAAFGLVALCTGRILVNGYHPFIYFRF